MIDIPHEAMPYLMYVYAALLGFLIGYERKRTGKYVGPRTYSLICLGACIFTHLSMILEVQSGSSLRLASQIISGLGFLGAGVIWKSENHIIGITTAASIWVAASVGMLVGFGFFLQAAFSAVLIAVIIQVKESQFFPHDSGIVCK